jgi:hypothetical protein
MDLNTVTELHRPTDRAGLAAHLDDRAAAPLAGGTWLFSQPQPALRALVDLTGLAWPSISVTPEDVEIAATCTLAELAVLRGAGRLVQDLAHGHRRRQCLPGPAGRTDDLAGRRAGRDGPGVDPERRRAVGAGGRAGGRGSAGRAGSG